MYEVVIPINNVKPSVLISLKLVNDNNNVVTIEDFLYDTENTYEIDDTCLKEFVVTEPCENK